jgi:hypothetical protein
VWHTAWTNSTFPVNSFPTIQKIAIIRSGSGFHPRDPASKQPSGILREISFMARSRIFVAAAIALSVAIAAPGVQAQAPAGDAGAPKPSKLKMTKERLHEMLAKWRKNRPKLKACRADARKKDLVDDARWFFIADCMEKP